jgi:hypothetical protein
MFRFRANADPLARCRRSVGRFALSLFLLITFASSARAQLTWEYSPYDIRLWIAADNHPALSGELVSRIGQDVKSACRGSTGYVWSVRIEEPPASLAFDAVYHPDAITVERLLELDANMLRGDKIVLLSVRESEGEFIVASRELDLPTRLWSDEVRFSTLHEGEIIPLASLAMVDVVRPIAKIDRVQGRNVRARLRAGGLITEPQTPASVAVGQVMQPVVRRNARNGEPLKNGIYAPNWSYLLVEEQTESAVHFALHSGFASVIPVKGGPRTERLALGFNPRNETTRLQIRSRPAVVSRGAAPVSRPLAGYEVFVKNPGDENTEFVGLTDVQGMIELESGEQPLRLFYIRNGGQLLGRLPLVVGHHAEATANVIDDDARLLAEAYVKALQSRVMDLVARREILAVRIRAKLKQGEYDAAKELVDEFRRLPSRAQLARELEDAQRRIGNVQGISGRRIEKQFLDGQRLVARFLDPNAADRLANEVAEAERRGPPVESQPASSEEPSTPPAVPAA